MSTRSPTTTAQMTLLRQQEKVSTSPMSFNPVVSLVCWILGPAKDSLENLERIVSSEKIMREQSRRKVYQKSHNCNHSTILWNGENSGNFSEYITVIQDPSIPNHSTTSSSNGSSSSNNYNDRTSFTEKNGVQLIRKIRSVETQEGELIASNNTPSPNWGFYVSITPPLQEHFRSAEDKVSRDMVSINEDYRRKSSSTSV